MSVPVSPRLGRVKAASSMRRRTSNAVGPLFTQLRSAEEHDDEAGAQRNTHEAELEDPNARSQECR